MANNEPLVSNSPKPPIIALDLGEKRIGVAISDELSISITRLKTLPRTNWKQLLDEVATVIRRFDAQTLVIGFPLRANGSLGEAAFSARATAEKFAKSLAIPVYLQNEHLSSVEAEETLRERGHPKNSILELVDAEAAAIILRDFIVSSEPRVLVPPSE